MSKNQPISLCTIDIYDQNDDLDYCLFITDVQENTEENSVVRAKEISRRLVALHHDVLACPVHVAHLAAKTQIGVLLDGRQREDLLLRDTFAKLSMTEISKRSPTPEDVNVCLIFAVTARLSPRWNPVGEFLVRSQDFLEIADESVAFQAVKLYAQTTNEDKLVISATGENIQMFPVSPHDLNIDAEELSHLMTEPTASIRFDGDRNHKFYYLPRFTSGKLVSISRILPEFAPFRNYSDLCLYWRQQHGYELPRDSADMVYFNVTFPGDNTIYSYPSCCVFLRHPLVTSPSRDILNEFWKDLAEILEPCHLTVNPQLHHDISAMDKVKVKEDRAAWQDKLYEDLHYDADVRAFWQKTAHHPRMKLSKYFIPLARASQYHRVEPAREELPKLVNAKITQFFPSQRPLGPGPTKAVSVQRYRNKITYKPAPGTAKEINVEEFAINDQLHKIRKADLQKWLRQKKIAFHSKDKHQKLMYLVNKHL